MGTLGKKPHDTRKLARVMRELDGLTSESVNPRTRDIDLATIPQILQAIHREDQGAVGAVGRVLGPIARAAKLYEETWRGGGRIFYIGAGTSGRLGVLDAAECPPTFGTDPKRIVGLIAGGRRTLVRSREGVEDDAVEGRELVRKHRVASRDLLIALAASRRTPFTLAALAEARKRRARTVFICTNPRGGRRVSCDVLIAPDVGPEVIAGSTRMKAGTAQKLVLNMLSTAAMIRVGKTYENRMIDLQARSEKLCARSLKLITELAGVSVGQAAQLLAAAGGRVKIALLMAWQGLDKNAALRQIEGAGGRLRRVTRRRVPVRSKQVTHSRTNLGEKRSSRRP
jgi:N-acetylmuramic acid 6-phosphate etherase